MTDTTQAADPTPDQLRQMVREARNSSGSASDDCGPAAYVLHGWRAALAAQAVPAIDVEKHMCGYARLGSDGVYKLVGMRRNPIMDDGDLHLILAFTDDQIEAFASPAPAEAKEEQVPVTPENAAWTIAEDRLPAHGQLVLCELDDASATRLGINFGFSVETWDEHHTLAGVVRWLPLNRLPESLEDQAVLDRIAAHGIKGE